MNALWGKIAITGGAGFLARAIYRRAQREGWQAEFTCISRDDHKHAALARKFPEVRCIRGDVAGDRDRLVAAFRGHDLVIHAGANKHVDLSEFQIIATVDVNVVGSINVGWAAIRAGVPNVVGISTDKACEPYNTYGLSKSVMERAFQEFDSLGDTQFRLARYGNVIASTGSVLTLFQKQVAQHGHLRLTDPGMTRFYMRADEAVDAIIRTAGCPRGFTYIPTCGAMTLADLASCAAPGAEVVVVGTRPGEKIHETLLSELEGRRAVPATEHAYLLGEQQHGWALAPMSVTEFPEDPVERYTSANPAWWWSPEAMLDAIADSEAV